MTEIIEVSSSVIRNYSVSKYDSEIVHVIINTEERCVEFQSLLYENQSCFNFCNKQIVPDFTGLIVELYHKEVLNGTIEINLKKYLTDSTRYVKLHSQEKDQISIYLIPMQLLTDEKKKQEYYNLKQ
jgi:hypothetical protein